MTSGYVDTLAALVDAREQAREVLVEMRGLLKDLRVERAEIRHLFEHHARQLAEDEVNRWTVANLSAMWKEHMADIDEVAEKMRAQWDHSFANLDRLATAATELLKRAEDAARG